MVRVYLHKGETSLEVHTGALKSVLSEETFKCVGYAKDFKPTKVSIGTYAGEPFEILGTADLQSYF